MANLLKKIGYNAGLTKRDMQIEISKIISVSGFIQSRRHIPHAFQIGGSYEGRSFSDILVHRPEQFEVTFLIATEDATIDPHLTIDSEILYDNLKEGEAVEIGYRVKSTIFSDYDPTDFGLGRIPQKQRSGVQADYVKKGDYVLYQNGFFGDEYTPDEIKWE